MNLVGTSTYPFYTLHPLLFCPLLSAHTRTPSRITASLRNTALGREGLPRRSLANTWLRLPTRRHCVHREPSVQQDQAWPFRVNTDKLLESHATGRESSVCKDLNTSVPPFLSSPRRDGASTKSRGSVFHRPDSHSPRALAQYYSRLRGQVRRTATAMLLEFCMSLFIIKSVSWPNHGTIFHDSLSSNKRGSRIKKIQSESDSSSVN
ncbi:hypothetical protein AUEXF2481DRAFT_385311 [Aureobasidium subglaciale EXF-2481]|uniref:Uncharacterized protein n=1 Tax=Aureobasidium subglaciale (strain EXF-2481) TaxID=1043005 RepID=A0A074YM86_AURSE|nr:uncharacterized protein AUEXF2481DRAFT_385311 [Aureobasidium subglaciale EXF-2481]KEQ98938.1 hypothetical protein AUEXF2481DRAFT_385311 [Aureobasidium subglaciale EXF-2481]